mgnify:CR=1 FL=1
MQAQTKSETENSHSQALAQLESIKELVAALKAAEDAEDDDAREEAERAIQEDALSIQVRGGWHTPDDEDGDAPEEFTILLCTGGPAVRIIGELDEHNQPSTLHAIHLEHQDWFTPWTTVALGIEDKEALVSYARCFYFGE